MRTNSKKFIEIINRYLLDSVYDFEGADTEKAQHAFDRFNSEYNYANNRIRLPSVQDRVAEWLSGLALQIEFYNCDIIRRWESWHGVTLSDKQAEKVCEDWFPFLAAKLINLWRVNGIDVYRIPND